MGFCIGFRFYRRRISGGLVQWGRNTVRAVTSTSARVLLDSGDIESGTAAVGWVGEREKFGRTAYPPGAPSSAAATTPLRSTSDLLPTAGTRPRQTRAAYGLSAPRHTRAVGRDSTGDWERITRLVEVRAPLHQRLSLHTRSPCARTSGDAVLLHWTRREIVA